MLDTSHHQLDIEPVFPRSSIIDSIPVALGYPARFLVDSHSRSWAVNNPEYVPVRYTAESVLRNDRTKNPGGYADPVHLTCDQFRALIAERKSLEGPIQTNPETGRPLNPLGRVGITDRGSLGKWGANQAADAIVTREYGDKLEVLLVRRPSGEWALPGGFVDSGETPLTTAVRELWEETGMDLRQFCRSANTVYEGIVADRRRADKADPRITDNAWVETTAFHFHLKEGHPSIHQRLRPENPNCPIRWAGVSREVAESLYACHGKLLGMAIAQSRQWQNDVQLVGQISEIPHEPLLTNISSLNGRIGILGGSFDPVHTEHVHLASIIQEKYGLDAVVFIPTNQNPLKEHSPSVSASARLTMLEIALADHPGFFVSPIQLRTENLSRTVDLVEHLKQELPPDRSQLFLILGADCIAELSRWKEPEKLLSLIDIIGCSREGHQTQSSITEFDRLTKTPDRNYASLHWAETSLSATSSTEIRKSLKDGHYHDGLDPKVFAYIKKHDLYG